ncbi:MAG: DNA-directed RNA polymerase subunit alpha C-terminal domain-containing protein [Candidatus Ornithomonoglobus sp.]
MSDTYKELADRLAREMNFKENAVILATATPVEDSDEFDCQIYTNGNAFTCVDMAVELMLDIINGFDSEQMKIITANYFIDKLNKELATYGTQNVEEYPEVEERSILLEDLNLSVKTYNALKRAGINNTLQLCSMEADKLRAIKGLEEKSLKEVVGRCAEFGITI